MNWRHPKYDEYVAADIIRMKENEEKFANDTPPPIPTAEDDLQCLRIERNKRLIETDWTQLPDVPQSTKDLWSPYRQQLRDITETYSSLVDVVWPTKPS